MKTITTTVFAAVCALLLVTGCQGRLHMLIYNDSGADVLIVSDGIGHALGHKSDIRLPTPSDRRLAIAWGMTTNHYAFPFNPRPITLNKYMHGGRLEIQIQIASDHALLVLPDGVRLPLTTTNESSEVMRISPEKNEASNKAVELMGDPLRGSPNAHR